MKNNLTRKPAVRITRDGTTRIVPFDTLEDATIYYVLAQAAGLKPERGYMVVRGRRTQDG